MRTKALPIFFFSTISCSDQGSNYRFPSLPLRSLKTKKVAHEEKSVRLPIKGSGVKEASEARVRVEVTFLLCFLGGESS